MRKVLFSSLLILVLLVASTVPTLAHHKGSIVGESKSASQINFPPVTAGPGLVLPDSPVFFLDRAKQWLRLALAITPEAKAKVHMEITGERLAEFRIMAARNDSGGMAVALHELGQEVSRTAANIADARARGRDVSELAKAINDTLKLERETLDVVESQAGDDLKVQIRAARTSVVLAKTEIEDALTQDELANEAKEDARVEVMQEFEVAEDAVRRAGLFAEQLGESKAIGSAIKKVGEEVKAVAQEVIKAQQKVAGVASESAK